MFVKFLFAGPIGLLGRFRHTTVIRGKVGSIECGHWGHSRVIIGVTPGALFSSSTGRCFVFCCGELCYDSFLRSKNSEYAAPLIF